MTRPASEGGRLALLLLCLIIHLSLALSPSIPVFKSCPSPRSDPTPPPPPPRLGEPCGELHLAAGTWGPQPLFGVARAPPDQPGSQDQVEGEEAKCFHFYSPGRCLVDALLRRLTEAVADDSEQTSLHSALFQVEDHDPPAKDLNLLLFFTDLGMAWPGLAGPVFLSYLRRVSYVEKEEGHQ